MEQLSLVESASLEFLEILIGDLCHVLVQMPEQRLSKNLAPSLQAVIGTIKRSSFEPSSLSLIWNSTLSSLSSIPALTDRMLLFVVSEWMGLQYLDLMRSSESLQPVKVRIEKIFGFITYGFSHSSSAWIRKYGS